MRKVISALLSVCLLTLIGYSGAQLWRIDSDAAAEQDLHEALLEQKPDSPGELDQLRAQNKDIAGWITIPFTNIDYPFVQGRDNSFYLRRDLNGEYAKAGTLFMDYRCEPGAGYTILYGHNMKNGSMFGTLGRFGEKSFFDAHPEGVILLEDGWHAIEFFAFLVVRADSPGIYGTAADLPYIAQNARCYRTPGPGPTDHIIVLSTCSYEFSGARMTLVGKITKTIERNPT